MVDKKLSEFTEASESEVSYFPVIDSNTKNRKLPARYLTGIKTNCITEIPQDIKLELNNGTLTLKAGSKVYVPNGAGVFDSYTSSADKTATNSTNGTYLVFTTKTFGYLALRSVDRCFSGSSATANIVSAWYDTTNNIVKYTSSGTTWLSTDGWTLPIALVTVSGGAIASIDQVFNGFGYIGSTIFVLPGVSGLIPNGRNADGTLKSTKFTSNSIVTRTFESTRTGQYFCGFNGSSIFISTKGFELKSDGFLYNLYDNTLISCCSLSSQYLTSGVVSNFNPKTAFHAVDYSDLFDGGHTYNGNNTYTGYVYLPSNTYLTKEDSNLEGGQLSFQSADNESNAGKNMWIDRYDGIFRFVGKDSNNTTNIPLKVDIQNNYAFAVTPSSATDNSTKIATTAWVNNAKSMIAGWGMPNYNAGVSKTTDANTEWTASGNGFVSIYKQVPYTSTNYYVYVNNQVVGYGISIECQSGMSTVFPVSDGDKIKYNVAVNSAVFYPCKGG